MVGPAGRFLLLDKLGQGGMGEVWRAVDHDLSEGDQFHCVALKFLSARVHADPIALEAIKSEVKRSRAIGHPNVVRIHELHFTDARVPFISMEFVDGRSLQQLLAEKGGVLEWRQVAEALSQLASALIYAHDTMQIVHRDIKPANLLLDARGTLKLSDFGIAQGLQSHGGDSSILKGAYTLPFASPQQILGESPSPSDDIYSVGATAYLLLSGTPPHEGRDPEEILAKISQDRVAPILQRLQDRSIKADIPARMLTLVHACLSSDPRLRPRAHELLHMLPQVSREQTRAIVSPAWKENREDASERPGNGHGWRTLLLLLIIGLTAGIWRYYSVRTEAPPEGPGTEPEIQGTATPRQNMEPANVAAQPSLPPAAAPLGTIRIEIRAMDRLPYWYQIAVTNSAGHQLLRSNFLARANESFALPCPAGVHRARILRLKSVQSGGGVRSEWPLDFAEVAITAGETTAITAPFIDETLHVQTDPVDASVSWARGEQFQTPFTRRFRSGLYSFEVTKTGYEPLQVPNYFFNPLASTNLVLTLTPIRYPVRGLSWTNSLGDIFLWVAPLQGWACAHEATIADFRAFSAESPDAASQAKKGMLSLTPQGWRELGHSWENPGSGFAQGPDCPAVGISLDDAQSFCHWLTERDQRRGNLKPTMTYALPTLEQWTELAGKGKYPWGESLSEMPKDANYSGAEARTSDWPESWPVIEWHSDPYPRTAPVLSGRPSARGFFHLGGNVAEWCSTGEVCGGSWFDGESVDSRVDLDARKALETASRVRPQPGERKPWIGLRLLIVESHE